MILPILLYCSNTLIGASMTNKERMEHIQLRTSRLINNPSTANILPNINHQRNKRCAVEVFKCLNGLSPCLFDDYFVKISHSKGT